MPNFAPLNLFRFWHLPPPPPGTALIQVKWSSLPIVPESSQSGFVGQGRLGSEQ